VTQYSEVSQPIPLGAPNFERILIVRPGAIGDLLVTLPVLANLRGHFPTAYIELVASPSVMPLVQGRCEADAVRSFDSPEIAGLFMADPPSPTRHWLVGFDLILAYIPADSICSRQLHEVARGRVVVFDPKPPSHFRLPMTLYLQRALEPLGIKPQFALPRIRLLREDMEFAADFWREVASHRERDDPIIVIHPGSGSPRKNWPAERFAALARRLHRSESARIAIVRGPADEEPVERMLTHCPEVQPTILADLSLPQLAAVLGDCQCFVGNDAGITHLAAALGLPGVVIFGPTDPRIWAPGPTFAIVTPKVKCAPCGDERRRGCERASCLESITVEEVYAAFQSLSLKGRTRKIPW